MLTLLFANKKPHSGLDINGHREQYDSKEKNVGDIYEIVINYMRAYGYTFRDPIPTFFDRERHRLCQITHTSAWSVLFPLGFAEGLPRFDIISKNLYRGAVSPGPLQWPEREVHDIAYMREDYGAIYIRASETSMLRVTEDDIDIVPLGEDDILVKSGRMGDLPSPAVLLASIAAIRENIGKSVTKLIPGSAVTDIINTRFAAADNLSPDQAHTFLVERILFLFAASQHRMLWPTVGITGNTSTGKSTPFECLNAVLSNSAKKIAPDSMPTKMRDLVALLTQSEYVILDNIDNAFAEAGDDVINLLCQVSTGGNAPLAELYKTCTLLQFNLQKTLFFTACNMPFVREDALRRIIQLRTEPGEGCEMKGHIINRALARRTEFWAEIALRCQNMLAAHRLNAERVYPMGSRMKEYEHFSLLCADYQGDLEETIGRWRALVGAYHASITLDNPLLTSMLLWVGQDVTRTKAPYSTQGLFKRRAEFHKSSQTDFGFKEATSLGKAISKNVVALKIGIGLVDGWDNKNNKRLITFEPSPEQLAAAVELYREFKGPKKTTALLAQIRTDSKNKSK